MGRDKGERPDILERLRQLDQRGLGFWVRHVLVDLLVISLVALVWVAIIRWSTTELELTTHDWGDLAGLLFGAASVSLFVVSFMLAVIALIGWTEVKTTIRQRVDAAFVERGERLADEIRGRLFVALSAAVSSISRHPETFTVERADLLKRAIHWSRRAQEYVKSEDEYFWGAQNNLAFTLALQGDPLDHDEALTLAESLEKRWRECRNLNLLLTHCRVILEYGDDEAKEKVHTILTRIGKGELGGEEEHKKEANAYLASFFSNNTSKQARGGG